MIEKFKYLATGKLISLQIPFRWDIYPSKKHYHEIAQEDETIHII